MKLDKEFKNETNQDFKEIDYVGKKIFIRGLIIVLTLVILGSIGGVAYKKWRVNQDRQIFKQSVIYNESASNYLAKSYQEYNEAESDTEKKAIMNYVIIRYPNLDVEKIDNGTLKQFYSKCQKN